MPGIRTGRAHSFGTLTTLSAKGSNYASIAQTLSTFSRRCAGQTHGENRFRLEGLVRAGRRGGMEPARLQGHAGPAAEAGLDVVSGLHTRLSSFPELVQAAARRGVRLIDVRHSEARYGAATGRKRSGKRLLTVGTDCALGKKYTALALTKNLQKRG